MSFMLIWFMAQIKGTATQLRVAIYFKTIDAYYLQFLQVQLSPQLQF